MITITAVIRARPGQETNLKDALCAVADNVARNEPETLDFYISQDIADPAVFTTYERFASEAAKDAHNGSAAVATFFSRADILIEQPVILYTCAEISSKPGG
jgi:quinol monooxygenase YgiN